LFTTAYSAPSASVGRDPGRELGGDQIGRRWRLLGRTSWKAAIWFGCDSTVTAALIHEPSDSALLWDAVRVMVRLLQQADALGSAIQ
jgi:glycerol-3-phosphate O-acyltransferase